jgi:hypothetical protein
MPHILGQPPANEEGVDLADRKPQSKKSYQAFCYQTLVGELAFQPAKQRVSATASKPRQRRLD